MATIAARLETARAGGASADDLATLASAFLGDADVTSAELAEPKAALAAAHQAWAALEAGAASAWERFPLIQSSGVHGGEPDPRAARLHATLAYVRAAGVYSPEQLAALESSSSAPARWVAREAVRLQALLVVLRALGAALDDGRLAPGDYADAVTGMCRRFSALRIAD